ncbi:hypothetical protein ES332_D02G175400v1 [Gossypium tomentosum]|uniref:USP domain-containing protein n=1 Tax=Gossypium tomentosum TaxID=34277 RepID=A0A5D2LYI8_GOSTO|nr:hypothetical protein ES332_D02G175400v1 [Gossypium tomentosum]TYH84098.1 hypothetical protein ES332_D02G175400v1 [Gossypium tomentosum]
MMIVSGLQQLILHFIDGLLKEEILRRSFKEDTVYKEPIFSIPGTPAVVQHEILNNRRHVLTKDAAGLVKLWEITRGVVVEDYGQVSFNEKKQQLFEMEELRYQLFAVAKHSGFRPTSGHYVCYIRSSPNMWHKMNDSRVTCVEEEAVLSQEAYILLYAKQGIPWFSTAIEVQKPCADPRISDSSPNS